MPEPRGRWFDSKRVNGAPEAYKYFETPDAFLGIVSYAVTACLAATGNEERWRTRPSRPAGLLLWTIANAVGAVKLTIDQIQKHRALCPWCLAAAGLTFATVPLAWKEGGEGIRQLQREWAERERLTEAEAPAEELELTGWR